MRKWTTIKRLCPFANQKIFLNLYKTYILPLIEYSYFAWIPNKTQTQKIESIQRHITEYISFKSGLKNLNYFERLEKLDLIPITVRKNLKVLTFIFKSIHNYTDIPNNWKNIFISIHTRNGVLIEKIHTRIKFCDQNFFIFALNLFNYLPLDIRCETNLSKFLTKCKSLLITDFKKSFLMY